MQSRRKSPVLLGFSQSIFKFLLVTHLAIDDVRGCDEHGDEGADYDPQAPELKVLGGAPQMTGTDWLQLLLVVCYATWSGKIPLETCVMALLG